MVKSQSRVLNQQTFGQLDVLGEWGFQLVQATEWSDNSIANSCFSALAGMVE